MRFTLLATLLATFIPSTAALADAPARAWKVLYREDFQKLSLPAAAWAPDTYPDDGPFADQGAYFRQQGVQPPVAYRAHASFGQAGWLTFESYSRSRTTRLTDLLAVTADPEGSPGQVLKLTSPAHTDATVIRPTRPLPPEYRVCVEVGYPEFGDGKPGAGNLNGYLGGETAEPWSANDSTRENGFYWLTILDAMPRPHNNVWIHHHRKVVIDSDNNKEGWTNIWDGQEFRPTGEHPVMMFGLSRDGKDDDRIGKPFISLSNGGWQPVGEIRAADAYRDRTWYEACIERTTDAFKLSTSGMFKYGGQARYEGTLPAAKIYHADLRPEYFMFGDPHNNFYRGTVYYRNLRLEVPR